MRPLPIPPVPLTLLLGAVAWFASWSSPGWLSWPREHTATGFLCGVLVAAGFTVMIAAVVSFRMHKTTVDPRYPDRAGALVTSGVFSISRNPMYVGMALLLVGWAIWLGDGIALIFPALFFALIDRVQIPAEEAALSEHFGEAYTAYCSKTRRWL
ncbi:MAG: isoprenylcysteine carboxylmethyltransferase family protein [Oceanicaulis sp.]